MQRAKGVLWAALSSATFGLAPLFTLLLLSEGYGPFEVLSYRWGVAAAFLFVCAALSGRSFRLTAGEWRTVFLLSLLRAATSFLLVISYANIASGTASTIHFMYPLAVALAMMSFFGEKRSWHTLAAVGVSIAGALLLSANGGEAQGDAILGTVCAVLTVFTYGGYMVGVRRSRAAAIDSAVLTCSVTAIGALLFFLGGTLTGGVRLEGNPVTWLWILGLALPATALSNITLVMAVKRIGPTLTALFGALEPLTSVAIGITFFGEPCTAAGVAGIFLILAAVSSVMLRSSRHSAEG